eukprot:577036-Alexandrium_andersonii.AAC.1
MSASLVGSEMCIRDRPGRVGTPASSSSASVGRSPPRRRSSGRPARPMNCLLYTSDAADDM